RAARDRSEPRELSRSARARSRAPVAATAQDVLGGLGRRPPYRPDYPLREPRHAGDARRPGPRPRERDRHRARVDAAGLLYRLVPRRPALADGRGGAVLRRHRPAAARHESGRAADRDSGYVRSPAEATPPAETPAPRRAVRRAAAAARNARRRARGA